MDHVAASQVSSASRFSRSWTISPKLLFAIYAIIPICIIVVAYDIFVLDGTIRKALPPNPYFWVAFALMFQLPHVTASELTFADPEYVKGYWPIIVKGLIIAGGLSLLAPSVIGLHTAVFILGAYTVYHGYMQQYGISLMFLKKRPDIYFHAWKWLSISGASMFYTIVLSPDVYYTPERLIPITIPIAMKIGYLLCGASFIPLFIFAYRALKNQSAKSIAVYYFIANPIMMTTIVALFSLGYPAVTIIIIRVVHDFTAYVVYITHDQNRNLGAPKNLVYKLLKPLRISPGALCLPVSLAVSYSLLFLLPENARLGWTGVMLFFHFYIEGHIWKHGTLHRQNTSFGSALFARR